MSDGRKILNALGSVDDKFIEEADEPMQPRRVRPNWKVWGACAAAAVAIAVGIGAIGGGIRQDAATEATVASVKSAADYSYSLAAPEAVTTTATSSKPEENIMEEADPMEDRVLTAETETEGIDEVDGSLILASLDNSDYLTKCASNGLVAGAPEYPETLVNPDAAYNMMDPDCDYEAYSEAYDEYYEEKSKSRENIKGYELPLKNFTESTAKEFMTASDDNVVYSPLNVYMAMSMLAELTEGESRAQILDLLGLPDIEAVREEARKLWLANYTNDGMTTLLLGSGAWVSDSIPVNQDALDALVDKYYAFYVVGDMSSEEMSQSFRDWLSEQTMGLLDDFISSEKFDPQTIMALASTIYYKAHWQDVFREEETEDAVFHSARGDQTVPFMNEKRTGSVKWGDNFTAVGKPMAGEQIMYFILPDEDSSVDQVLESDQFWAMINDEDYENVRHGCIVTMSVPKFDVSSGSDLIDGLMELGVKDVFVPSDSDFSSLTSEEGVYVGKVSHNARVKIDEEGVEASAYTAMLLCGASMPNDYVDFICDRPFIFAIKNYDGAVLFMGTVNSIK